MEKAIINIIQIKYIFQLLTQIKLFLRYQHRKNENINKMEGKG